MKVVKSQHATCLGYKMVIFNIVMVGILILLTAFFVATEFALVKIRESRINYLVEDGNKKAINVKKILDNLDGYLSACQLGITVTALGLGWLGEPTIERLLRPLFDTYGINASVASILSFGIAFLTITFLHVVVGELAPKTIAIQKAESVALLLARPLILFYKLMYPFIWVLNGTARNFIRLFGFKPAGNHDIAHTEEELRLILSDSYQSGEINLSEMLYVDNVFEFDNRLAKEIMVPRTEMICLFKEDSPDRNRAVMHENQHMRFPVAGKDKDDIMGLVNIKHMFNQLYMEDHHSIDSLILPIIHTSERTPLKQLLFRMQKERIYMAIVIDEYGGTAGLVTLKDILEEIVGEIHGEFDVPDDALVKRIDEKTMIVPGKFLLEDINDMLHTELMDDHIDTIGGWLLTNNPQVVEGTTVEQEGHKFIVEEMNGFQMKKVRIVSKNPLKQSFFKKKL